jgi:hypothetical protein
MTEDAINALRSAREPADDPSAARASMSRRAVLKRVGWIVPVLTVLPLSSASAHTTFASPGARSSSGSPSGGGNNWGNNWWKKWGGGWGGGGSDD